jgi:hypothetical protein
MAAITQNTLVLNSVSVTHDVVTCETSMGCALVAMRDLATRFLSHQRSQARHGANWQPDLADNRGAVRSAARAGRSERRPEVLVSGSPIIGWGQACAARRLSAERWSKRGVARRLGAFLPPSSYSGSKPAQTTSAGMKPAGAPAFATMRG